VTPFNYQPSFVSTGGGIPDNLKPADRICYPDSDGEGIVIKSKRHSMHLSFTPLLASAVWIGGGSVSLLLVIIVVVLLMRR